MKIHNTNKCGEIFRDGPELFTFGCTLCTELFNTTKEILDHVETHFLYGAVDATQGLKSTPPEGNEANALQSLMPIKQEDVYVSLSEPISIKEEATIDIEEPRKTRCSSKRIAIQSTDKLFSNNEDNWPFSDDIRESQIDSYASDSEPVSPKSEIFQLPKQRTKTPRKLPKTIKAKRKKKIPRDTIVNCKVCGKAVRADGLKDHSEIHSDELKYSCPVCEKKFKTRLILRNHKNSHRALLFNFDPQDLNVMCDICGLIVRTKGVLRLHIRTHTGEKPYQCKICGKAWANSGGLTIHMRTHTGEKPYKCDQCNDSYARKPDLDRHTRKNHNTEKRFKCDDCDRTFMDSGSLVEHKRVHTGERPYTCEICYRSFSRSKIYRQHKYLHSGEKRYKCKYCEKTFAQSSSCYSHERCFHKKIRRKPKVTKEAIVE